MQSARSSASDAAEKHDSPTDLDFALVHGSKLAGEDRRCYGLIAEVGAR